MITLQLGSNLWTFGFDFLMYLVVAALVGFVAEGLVGKRLPFGFVGAILASLIGIWLLTKVIIITGVGDIDLYGLPLVRAFIGAIIFVSIWQFIAYGFRHGMRRRFSSRSH